MKSTMKRWTGIAFVGLAAVVFAFPAFAETKSGSSAQSANQSEPSSPAKVPTSQPVPPAVQAALNDDLVIAQVNETKITLGQFKQLLAAVPPAFQPQIAGIKGRLLDERINQEILAQEAAKQGMDKDAEVLAALDRAKKELMVRKLYQDQIGKKLGEVSDKEAKDFFTANVKQFERPERIRVSHILVKTEKEAKDLLAKLKLGEPFRDLAEKNSKDPSSVDGGDVGYIVRGQAVAEFDEASFALKNVGDLSAPVKTQFGYHIIRLTDRKAPEIPKFEDVQTEARNRLLAKKQQEALEQYLDDLKSKSQIQINVKLLDEIK